MVESLAVEWGPYGITVNGLVPGLILYYDMTADIRSNLSRADSDLGSLRPALRVGTRRKLGCAATFLASPYAGSSQDTPWWSTAPTGSAGP